MDLSHSIQILRQAVAQNIFLRWRAERLGWPALFDKADAAPPEELLQQVWRYQRLVQERLQTIDGRTVRILHPGFWNREAGPDFRNAVVQFGDAAPQTGDVEIDIVPAGWRHHAHEGNPNYRDVILHVTWEPASGADAIPALCLKHALDSTVPELSFWLGLEPKPAPDSMPGQCSGPLTNLEPRARKEILRQAAEARLCQKAEQIQAWARRAGWDGALWLGIFSALGYKRNVWPMRRLAESVQRLRRDLPEGEDGLLLLEARCFGVAGLLSNELRGRPAAEYQRRIWDLWWRDAESFRDLILPRAVWNFAGIRPANHPQRRVALAARWLFHADLPERLERWIGRTVESPDLVPSLEEILRVSDDPFWSYRWTWNSKPFRNPHPLLGESRLTDIAINVILPWLYVRACAGSNDALAAAAKQRYFLWPPGEDNSVLRLARERLLGGIPAEYLNSAAEQQGLIQITRDFCEHSNSACQNCRFPDLIRSSSSN